ncbi:PREDICTED: uncharacterized protein KIAA1143 homolog [Chlamydotis macqueenii]|nr:PREDICTED: uncharacterized protein KIAA1143 homolog [Chlamydotis macqueenii]
MAAVVIMVPFAEQPVPSGAKQPRPPEFNWPYKVQREQLPLADDDSDNGSDKEDEQPQVVTLKKGDLTAEEAMKIKQQIKEALKSNESDGEPEPADGKIMFRKPAKRSSEKLLDFNVSSSKKMKEAKKTKREATTPQSTAKQIKNSSLLSFDDEENDD